MGEDGWGDGSFNEKLRFGTLLANEQVCLIRSRQSHFFLFIFPPQGDLVLPLHCVFLEQSLVKAPGVQDPPLTSFTPGGRAERKLCKVLALCVIASCHSNADDDFSLRWENQQERESLKDLVLRVVRVHYRGTRESRDFHGF